MSVMGLRSKTSSVNTFEHFNNANITCFLHSMRLDDWWYHWWWYWQTNWCMLQQEAPCHPSLILPDPEESVLKSSTTQTRQFSSSDQREGSDQPNWGTASPSSSPVQTQSPSASMSFPDVQNSLKCLLDTFLMRLDNLIAFDSLLRVNNLELLTWQYFLASIQVTFSCET